MTVAASPMSTARPLAAQALRRGARDRDNYAFARARRTAMSALRPLRRLQPATPPRRCANPHEGADPARQSPSYRSSRARRDIAAAHGAALGLPAARAPRREVRRKETGHAGGASREAQRLSRRSRTMRSPASQGGQEPARAAHAAARSRRLQPYSASGGGRGRRGGGAGLPSPRSFE